MLPATQSKMFRASPCQRIKSSATAQMNTIPQTLVINTSGHNTINSTLIKHTLRRDPCTLPHSCLITENLHLHYNAELGTSHIHLPPFGIHLLPLLNSCTKPLTSHYAPPLTKHTHFGLIHPISALHSPPTSPHSCVTYNATLSPLCGTPNTHYSMMLTLAHNKAPPHTLPLPLATLTRPPPAHGSYDSVTHTNTRLHHVVHIRNHSHVPKPETLSATTSTHNACDNHTNLQNPCWNYQLSNVQGVRTKNNKESRRKLKARPKPPVTRGPNWAPSSGRSHHLKRRITPPLSI